LRPSHAGLDLGYTATASPGSVFNNWFGPCESEVGTTCTVDRQDPELAGQTVIITAVFLSQGPTLTVTESIGGRVTSTPTGGRLRGRRD
jgi:hypothetical protein